MRVSTRLLCSAETAATIIAVSIGILDMARLDIRRVNAGAGSFRSEKSIVKLARRMARLQTESAFRVLAQAQALEARGVNIVHLEIGEPDFPTPMP